MAKICLKCGGALEDDARFCPQCGSEYGVAPICAKCGRELAPGTRFCPGCGAKQIPASNPGVSTNGESYIKKGFDTFVTTINTMAGESGKVDIHVKELFSEVFKKHTQEEKDELFVCGTGKTTPKESEMVSAWPRPWLFSRVFLMFAVVFAGLYIMVMEMGNANGIPGAMFVGALLVPLTVMIFFWEVNVPRNISFVDVISVFFVGGVFSLVVTLILFEIFPAGELDYTGAIVVGIVEEVGKAIPVAYYIKKRNTRYKLNGLLLGACVGAGFAVFETAGYAFRFLLNYGSLDVMMDVLFQRGVLAIGGHVVWAAISGVGLVVAKGDEPLKAEHLYSGKFLKFLVLVAALHAVWDMPIKFGSEYNLVQWCLTVIALATVLVLLGSGLRQVSTIAEQAQMAEAQQEESGAVSVQEESGAVSVRE